MTHPLEDFARFVDDLKAFLSDAVGIPLAIKFSHDAQVMCDKDGYLGPLELQNAKTNSVRFENSMDSKINI